MRVQAGLDATSALGPQLGVAELERLRGDVRTAGKQFLAGRRAFAEVDAHAQVDGVIDTPDRRGRQAVGAKAAGIAAFRVDPDVVMARAEFELPWTEILLLDHEQAERVGTTRWHE